jgi:hypothetical protein
MPCVAWGSRVHVVDHFLEGYEGRNRIASSIIEPVLELIRGDEGNIFRHFDTISVFDSEFLEVIMKL